MIPVPVCSVKYIWPTKPKEKKRKDIQKVFYGHRLTQINADENHKLLIDFGRSALHCSVTVKRRMKHKKKWIRVNLRKSAS
jgi:hypothetical protein